MNDYINSLLNYCEKIVIRYDEISKLLMAPEISIDVRLYRRLQSELNSKKEIVEVYKKIKDNLYLVTTYEKELNSKLNNFSQLKEELEKINKEIKEDENLLIKLINKSQDNTHSFYIELALNKKSNSNFGLEVLKDIYLNYIIVNNGTVNIESKESGFIRLSCDCSGVFELVKKDTGIHKLICENEITICDVLIYKNRQSNKFFISQDDIKIDKFHASGAGGQNINKVETAIRATHIPTGIVVTCQDERSQLKNKERALEKLEQKVLSYYDNLVIEQNIKDKKEMQALKNNSVRIYNVSKNEIIDTKIGESVVFNLNDIKNGNLDKILALR